jgi:hypothetical protein
MTPKLPVCLVSLCCVGCIAARRDPSCQWPDEAATRLDVTNAAHQRHLNDDVRVAEELAVRYADVTRGHRSGRYQGADEYRRTRDRCFAALSQQIADRHGVRPSQVADAVGQRDERLDAAVLVLFAALYGLAANSVVRRLFARFPPAEEPWPALTGIAAAAVVLSAAAVMIGGLGAAIVEMIHLGATHLSYRASRIPWGRHWPLLFAGGIVLLGVIAAIRWRRQIAIP